MRFEFCFTIENKGDFIISDAVQCVQGGVNLTTPSTLRIKFQLIHCFFNNRSVSVTTFRLKVSVPSHSGWKLTRKRVLTGSSADMSQLAEYVAIVSALGGLSADKRTRA